MDFVLSVSWCSHKRFDKIRNDFHVIIEFLENQITIYDLQRKEEKERF